jgi:hypothetical protein
VAHPVPDFEELGQPCLGAFDRLNRRDGITPRENVTENRKRKGEPERDINAGDQTRGPLTFQNGKDVLKADESEHAERDDGNDKEHPLRPVENFFRRGIFKFHLHGEPPSPEKAGTSALHVRIHASSKQISAARVETIESLLV